ncbi:Enteropeptidase, partial [Orchesella cincta]
AYTRISAYMDWIYGIVNGDHSQYTSYQRPKNCTTRCLKPGGECLFYEDKCNGPVNCLGAYDEVGCSHVLTRARDIESDQPLPYWANYPRQRHQTAQSMSRSVFRAPNYGVVPGMGAYRPLPMLSRPVHTSRQGRKVQCDSDEFQCQPLDTNNLSGCIAMTQVCDGRVHCSQNLDETQCAALTKDYKEPLDLSQVTTGEVKGYVMTRFQGLDWHPAVMDWNLALAQTLCSNIMEGTALQSLETIQLAELAERPPFQSLLEATIINSGNGNIILNQRPNSANVKTTSGGGITKVKLNPSNINGVDFDLGFLRCAK